MLDYVQTNGSSDPSFFIWGNWPVVYWWADQPLVSRFIYDTGLTATWAPEMWRSELIDDLRAHPPHFIAVAASDPQPWLTGTDKTSVELLDDYGSLKELLSTGYEPTWANDLFRLYLRK